MNPADGKPMTKKRRTLGYVFFTLGGICTFVFLSPIFPIGVEAFLIGGLFFAAGAWVLAGRDVRKTVSRGIRARGRRPAVAIDPLLPVRILRLARERGGSITVSDVATALDVPLDQAEEGLRACVHSGNAVEDFDIPRGYTLFRFPEFMSPEERNRIV
jgi:hypothetical protein